MANTEESTMLDFFCAFNEMLIMLVLLVHPWYLTLGSNL